MNCLEFDRWLDRGMPHSLADAAMAHAAACARCEAEGRAARTIEATLSVPAASGPAGFTDRVMQRVRTAAPRIPAPAPAPDLAWWIQAAAEPAVALAAAVAALLAWRGPELWRGSRALGPIASWVAARLGTWRLPHLLEPSLAERALAWTALVAVLSTAWMLYHWCERLVLRPSHRGS